MKAIIVSDVELNALLDRLELKKFHGEHSSSYEKHSKEELDATHRWFHYHVCRWIQEVGGEVKRS